MKKIVFIILTGLFILLTGCALLDDGKEREKEKEREKGKFEVSFLNFSSASIRVNNLSSERLIAFKDTISKDTLISGIPAYADNYGLRNDNKLFNNTDIFTLVLITEKQYKDNVSNLSVLNNQAFAKLFVFYPIFNQTNIVFTISASLGGSGLLSISNPMPYDVTFHKDSPIGEMLGYAPKSSMGNIIRLKVPEDYMIYPVFRLFHPLNKELYSVIPTFTMGPNEGKPYWTTILFYNEDLPQTLDLSELGEIDFNLTSGGTFLKVINNSGIAVNVWRNNQPVYSTLGNNVINAGHSNVFFLDFIRNPDGTIPQNQTLHIKIGTLQNQLDVQSPMPFESYEIDWLHEIEVTGSNAPSLELGTVTKVERINLEQLFGLK